MSTKQRQKNWAQENSQVFPDFGNIDGVNGAKVLKKQDSRKS
jgi:hypothetical protein